MVDRAPLVRKLIGRRVHVEHGSVELAKRDRVAVLAQWSGSATLSRSVITLVTELQRHGYHVVVSSACGAPQPLTWTGELDAERLTVLRKPNIGYDFGSWSTALRRIPAIASAPRVLFVNDSMVGPFVSLTDVLSKFDGTAADVWGLTDTTQFGHHLQSYFLGFRDGVLRDRPVAAFWNDVRDHADKMNIIFENEVGFATLLREEGYACEAAFPYQLVVQPGHNPVILGWQGLLAHGFPFLKREILRDPAVAPLGMSAPRVIKRLFDIDVDEWVSERVTTTVD